VQRTPYETEDDVIFSRSCDQEKKKLESKYVLSSPEGVRRILTALVFEATFAKTAFAVVSSPFPMLSEFYSPVCFELTTLSVCHSRRTPTWLKNS